MKISIRKGLGFGLTSVTITTLGLIIGLNSGTKSKLVVLAGILTLAIADAFSDALSMHISEESGSKNIKQSEIWEATIATFISKIFFGLSFVIPVLLFDLNTAIIIDLVYGLSLITLFSYYIARQHKTSPTRAIAEHLTIAILVITITYFVGTWISNVFV